MSWNNPNPDIRFQVGDVIRNIHTGSVSKVIKVETKWAIPIYEVQYVDSGNTLRFNLKYEQNWEFFAEVMEDE